MTLEAGRAAVHRRLPPGQGDRPRAGGSGHVRPRVLRVHARQDPDPRAARGGARRARRRVLAPALPRRAAVARGAAGAADPRSRARAAGGGGGSALKRSPRSRRGGRGQHGRPRSEPTPRGARALLVLCYGVACGALAIAGCSRSATPTASAISRRVARSPSSATSRAMTAFRSGRRVLSSGTTTVAQRPRDVASVPRGGADALLAFKCLLLRHRRGTAGAVRAAAGWRARSRALCAFLIVCAIPGRARSADRAAARRWRFPLAALYLLGLGLSVAGLGQSLGRRHGRLDRSAGCLARPVGQSARQPSARSGADLAAPPVCLFANVVAPCADRRARLAVGRVLHLAVWPVHRDRCSRTRLNPAYRHLVTEWQPWQPSRPGVVASCIRSCRRCCSRRWR